MSRDKMFKPEIEPTWLDEALVRRWMRVRGMARWVRVDAALVARYTNVIEGPDGHTEREELYLSFVPLKGGEAIEVKLADDNHFYFWVPDGETIPLLVDPDHPENACFAEFVPAATGIRYFLGGLIVFAVIAAVIVCKLWTWLWPH